MPTPHEKCWNILRNEDLCHCAVQSDQEKEGEDTFLEDPRRSPLHPRNQSDYEGFHLALCVAMRSETRKWFLCEHKGEDIHSK